MTDREWARAFVSCEIAGTGFRYNDTVNVLVKKLAEVRHESARPAYPPQGAAGSCLETIQPCGAQQGGETLNGAPSHTAQGETPVFTPSGKAGNRLVTARTPFTLERMSPAREVEPGHSYPLPPGTEQIRMRASACRSARELVEIINTGALAARGVRPGHPGASPGAENLRWRSQLSSLSQRGLTSTDCSSPQVPYFPGLETGRRGTRGAVKSPGSGLKVQTSRAIGTAKDAGMTEGRAPLPAGGKGKKEKQTFFLPVGNLVKISLDNRLFIY